MPKKIKAIARLTENIGFIVFGITNVIGGTYLWTFHPFLAISLYILSVISIVRGISELLEVFFGRGNR